MGLSAAGKDIVDRTFAFSIRVVKLVRALPRDTAASTIARQLVRSGMSVGANVEEAQGASTKREFTRRMNIARAEAREALYWLRLLAATEILSHVRLREIIDEADELVRILTTIVKKAGKAEGGGR